MDSDLVSSCGIYCKTCSRFMDGNCLGCLTKTYKCRIKMEIKGKRFAFESKGFPGQFMKKLDEKYKRMYNTNLIDNLKLIKSKGVKNSSNLRLKE